MLSTLTSQVLEDEARLQLKQKGVVTSPKPRTFHAGCVFGPGLLIHGGQSGESLQTVDDWGFFDFGLGIWIGCLVEMQGHDDSTVPFELARKMHSLTPVVDPAISDSKELTRLAWTTPLAELAKHPTYKSIGIYMFAGLDS